MTISLPQTFRIRIALVVVLVLAVVFDPTWPLVVSLLISAFYAGLAEVLEHLAARDTRLDVEARRDAKRAALVMDEVVKRLQNIEEWQSVVKMNQHRGPTWQQVMQGGA